jgi:hypothetical protein
MQSMEHAFSCSYKQTRDECRQIHFRLLRSILLIPTNWCILSWIRMFSQRLLWKVISSVMSVCESQWVLAVHSVLRASQWELTVHSVLQGSQWELTVVPYWRANGNWPFILSYGRANGNWLVVFCSSSKFRQANCSACHLLPHKLSRVLNK